MANNELKLLDCTLRDGGYVNDWKWGYQNAKAIIHFLVKSKVDFIEIGFLRNVEEYNEDILVCNTIEELNRLVPEHSEQTVFSAMMMQSNYDINKLSDYSGKGIELIRITAHDYDIIEGLKLAQIVKSKGYKVSINPINIMGYSDERILEILNEVNLIQPYQFSIVDTFGSMKRRDLDRLVSLVDNNLEKEIRVALHLHENMSLSCCLAQNFIDKHLNRSVTIDGSLMGMGRIPGNLPIELIADYCNEYIDSAYDIDCFLDAIQEYIAPIRGQALWGYTPAYFLSAKHNVHRNYAEYFLAKGDLTNRDINHILATFDRNKATVYDENYAEKKYHIYKNCEINDSEDRMNLKAQLAGKRILIIAPGRSIVLEAKKISEFMNCEDVCSISINFIPEELRCDYAFFSNSKRYAQAQKTSLKLILTSNVETERKAIRVNYNSVSSAVDEGYNSFVMILKLLKDLGINEVFAAGADGYCAGEQNYYNSALTSLGDADMKNYSIGKAINRLGIRVCYLTESAYQS